MVFGTIGTLIDKIKELVVDYLNGIAGQFNDTVDEIRNDISKVSRKLDEVKETVEANKISGEIRELQQNVENIKSGISDSVQSANTISGKIWELQQNVENIKSGISDGVQGEIGTVKDTVTERFDAVDEKLTTLTENFNKLLGEQAAELNNLRIKAAEVGNLSTAVAEKEDLIKTLDEKIRFLEEKSGRLEKELGDMDVKLTGAQDELKAERQSSAAVKEALQMWRDSVANYAPVREAMRKCDTFNKLLEERGLNDETDAGLFAFVQELGKTMDFLRDVHQAALDAKKAQGVNPTRMSNEELAVYEALNNCYRRIWNIDFDVFATPGERKSVGDNFYKIPFSKDDALVLKDLRNRSMRFVTGLYVPLLLNREGKMYKQAYVEASNL